MFGVGPGALPSDAFMMGIAVGRAARHDGGGARGDPAAARAARAGHRRRPTGSRSTTPASSSRPYTDPRFEIAVAAQISPVGSARCRPVRRSGCCPSAPPTSRASTCSAPTGRSWRSGPRSSAHRRPARLAPRRPDPHRRDQGAGLRRTSQFGLADWVDYFQRVAALPLAPGHDRRRRRWPTR